ncbi:MAG: replication-associated recombination protein A [Oscillospiraceae bacterium]|nr:replication-associated recombination protein A [Oscillospiraceae bacterium]
MRQNSLFENYDFNMPLASRMRPSSLSEFVGQEHLVGEGRILQRLIEKDMLSSMIFWGPPGVGKTTLARIIAEKTNSQFIDYSAVTSGIKEIKAVMAEAEQMRLMERRTILFIDEIHRFNKAQQDAFLPYVERGSIILIGATTENPSFEVNAALLSRCKVFVMHMLSVQDIHELLVRTMNDERGFGKQNIDISDDMLSMIANFANGDARTALSTLEMVIINSPEVDDSIVVSSEVLEQVTSKKILLYDKDREEHYNIISALHKSMRNSDVNAAIYWLARMLEAGENPLYVARRIVRFASEDIGMADSRALEVAVAAYQACHFIGMPECNVHLTHAVTYLSLAPKSNSLTAAYEAAAKDANDTISEPVPLTIRNAPTGLMKQLGYGKDYMYAHNYEDKITSMQCLPDSLKDRHYYIPTEQGSEKRVKERLLQIEQWHKEHDGVERK